MLSSTTQAVLLLTCHFGGGGKEPVKPLSAKEWSQFAIWLKDQNLTPSSLVFGNPEEPLKLWSDSKISIHRLLELLNRGPALGLAVEKWLRAGLWIITRSDSEYPQSLRIQLKHNSPPCLFGCGNKALLNQGGIAVIGSRNASNDDLSYSKQLGRLAAQQGYSVISGGARGIDEAAMIGALEIDGTAVGVMADSLLKSISSSKYRRHLQNNNLALISSFNPEAGFSTGNAMQRNKYIYCMSQAAIAVHSGTSGGTWTGANENLSKGWTPLWTKHSSDPDSGNQLLVKAGAYLIQDSIDQIEIADLIGRSADVHRDFVEVSEVNEIAQSAHSSESHHFIDSKDLQSNLDILNINSPQKVSESHEKLVSEQVEQKSEPANDSTTITQGNEPILDTSKFDIYEFFLTKVASWCSAKSCDLEELESLSGVSKTQLTIWVKRAVQEGHLVKQSRPVKYLWSSSQQSNLFG